MSSPRSARAPTSGQTRGIGRRVLAVDLGERRIGVAISDASRSVARELGTVQARGPKSDARAVRELAADLDVGLLLNYCNRRR